MNQRAVKVAAVAITFSLFYILKKRKNQIRIHVLCKEKGVKELYYTLYFDSYPYATGLLTDANGRELRYVMNLMICLGKDYFDDEDIHQLGISIAKKRNEQKQIIDLHMDYGDSVYLVYDSGEARLIKENH